MPTVHSIYQGQLRCNAVHVRSQSTLITDAPTDNQGKGEAFSPTDLLATALGTCMLTIMGIRARNEGIDIDGTEIDITKVMASGPRRVAEVIVDFKMPNRAYSEAEKSALYIAAVNCPVAKSLSAELKQTVSFTYSDGQNDKSVG